MQTVQAQRLPLLDQLTYSDFITMCRHYTSQAVPVPLHTDAGKGGGDAGT